MISGAGSKAWTILQDWVQVELSELEQVHITDVDLSTVEEISDGSFGIVLVSSEFDNTILKPLDNTL
jgi:hypothetical protein